MKMAAKKNTNKIKRTKLALQYEKIWHKLYYQLPRWQQQAIVEEPFGRHASELAKMVADEAEKGE